MKKFLQLFVLGLLVPTLFLQAGTTGKLAGHVKDAATGEPLPFVNITIEGTQLGAATDIDGDYVILNISPGLIRCVINMLVFNR
ncbi:MAG: carboxypeptidase-like regulatory domain-containing protein [Melioribacteraceae bacterium]|nr:carboxypeptidase-like regulatory domain-containing protein [Melioribacteraceae bacterium]